MRIYLIYAIMTEEIFQKGNRYGQYDAFLYGNGKNLDGSYCVLWGFTDRKKYKERFLQERPVKHRFLIQEKEVSEAEYSNFMMEYFRYELLPTCLDQRINIGERSGFQTVRRMTTRVSPEEESFYSNKIMTKYEYDYLANNLGEICTDIEKNLVNHPILPVDSNVFSSPVKTVLDFLNYNQLCRIYHPNGPKYLIHRKEQGENIDFRDFTRSNEKPSDATDLFSMKNLFYTVFAEVIYKEGV